MLPTKIKLLVLTPSLVGGGAEKIVFNILNKLDKSKFAITLLIPLGSESVIIPDVNVIRLKNKRISRSIFEIITLMREGKFDYIFTTHFHYSIVAFLAKTLAFSGAKNFVRESNYRSEIVKSLSGKLFYSFFYNFCCHKLILQSPNMETVYHNYFKVKKNKTLVIPNFLDGDSIIDKSKEKINFSKSKGNIKTVMSFGRLEKAKGFDLLIKDIALNINESSNLVFYIFGDGSEFDNLQNLIINNKLSDKIKLMGFVNNPYPFILQADIIALPSRLEGFPNIVLECLKLNKRVISYDISGVVDIPYIDKVPCQPGLFIERLLEVLNESDKDYSVDLSHFESSIKKYESIFSF
ncbi:glycosyltransferase [Shewanella sp. MMG014]|uniref:glycosyltransferase n=1 Tax=Shewanella sp. MMG014 TaxID=2822691 RepID=UPI001B381903|nr:glycosyltransferase [Shewanella sp. MMG014]MBQ4888543.1 glycosyltransferase [Shewanella sp. MMG014]